MAEGTYEYECMRAELLGVEAPDYDVFIRKQQEERNREAEEEVLDAENLKLAEEQTETLQSTSGKLDELSNILVATQKKIDGFKIRCGSVTDMIKTKISGISVSLSQGTNDQATEVVENDQSLEVAPQANGSTSPKKAELTKTLDNHVDKLDNMVDKADDIVSRLNDQNTRMKKLLNK